MRRSARSARKIDRANDKGRGVVLNARLTGVLFCYVLLYVDNYTRRIVYVWYSVPMVEIKQQIKAVRQINAMKTIIAFALLFVLGVGYMVWLDAGCERVGVMTWQGKVCAESL